MLDVRRWRLGDFGCVGCRIGIGLEPVYESRRVCCFVRCVCSPTSSCAYDSGLDPRCGIDISQMDAYLSQARQREVLVLCGGKEEEVLELSGADLYQNVDTHMPRIERSTNGVTQEFLPLLLVSTRDCASVLESVASLHARLCE